VAARVTATPAALEAIARLRDRYGAVSFHQSGGCCDGSSPMCLCADELPAGPHDRLLGDLGGAPFYIDAEQDDRWGTPTFVIDVAEGSADSFSLEGSLGVHFVARTP
jgi:uncharacterized protein (DUF779 family)